MSFELILRDEVHEDVSSAFHWYKDRKKRLGSDFLIELDATFHVILRTPTLFPINHKDIRVALLRRFPYAVYFAIEQEYIVILAVLHQSRSRRKILRKRR